MTDKFYGDHKSRVPICVDVNAGSIPGSAHHHVNSIVSFMEATCKGIRCPPYFKGAEILCVVCTKYITEDFFVLFCSSAEKPGYI